LRQSFGRAAAQHRSSGRPLGAHVGRPEAARARSSDHDQIDPSWQEVGPRSKRLSAEALDSVAQDRVAHFARDNQSNPRRRRRPKALSRRRLPRHEQREVRRRDTPADALSHGKLAVTAQPATRPEGERAKHGGAERISRRLELARSGPPARAADYFL
jgi:hypothetical protein